MCALLLPSCAQQSEHHAAPATTGLVARDARRPQLLGNPKQDRLRAPEGRGFSQAEKSEKPAKEPPEKDWRFELVPYVWLAGINGDVGGSTALAVNESFSSLAENLEAGFMGAMRVRYKRFGFAADGNYLSFGSSAPLSGPLASGINLDLTAAFGTGQFMYEFEPEPGLSLNPYLGARWWSIHTNAQLQGGVLGGLQRDFGRAWADPVVGVYARNDISDRWFVEFAGDVGGGVSKVTWQVYGAVGYELADWFGLSAGYRFLGVNYCRDGFLFDVVTQGLLLGLRFGF